MTDLEKAKQVMGYLIGYRIGSQMLPQMLPGISAEDVVAEMLAQGVADAMADKGVNEEIVNGDVEKHQQVFFAALQERSRAKGEANRELGRKYMEENGKREGVVTTESGLQYEVITSGGSEKYDAAVHGEAPTAEVMYKGTLVDGTVFDQSQAPVKFNIRQVIPGFTEALKLMPVGAKWRVTIPSDLAYGTQGPGSIGPNSTLIFEMELISLTK